MDNKILIKALEMDRNGNWEEAHHLAQAQDNKGGYAIHAYLHRKEGDLSNAAYWYAKADKPVPDTTLEAEWQMLYQDLIKA